MATSTFTERVRPECALLALVTLLTACGGGADAPDSGVAFEGFAFRLTPSLTVVDPPVEVLDGPLSFGAPLDTVVVFHFDGVPEGPFDATTLPIATTPEQIGVDVPTTPGKTIFAKGSYVRVGTTVEFRPFVPTEPLDPASPDPDAVPGLLPGTLYDVSVSAVPGASLKNLVGPGDATSFGTTSIPSAYYPPATAPYAAPTLVKASSEPLAPGVFDATPYGFAPTVEPGAAAIELVYDRALSPTQENLDGRDLDGDGVVEPTWSLRVAASDLIVGHGLAPGSSLGNETALGVVAALRPDAPVPADGSALAVNFPEATTPTSMAFGGDGSVLFALLAGHDGATSLVAVDHVTGDAAGARASLPVLLDRPLCGLVRHVDGRLLAIDVEQRRIVELRVEVTRSLPHGEPTLHEVVVGPANGAFAGNPWSAELDVLDLVVLVDGSILALVQDGPGGPRRLVETVPFDPTASGTPAPDAGAPTNTTIAAGLSPGLCDVHAADETSVWGVDRDLDAVVRVDLKTGSAVPVVLDVSSYGTVPGGVRCIARAFASHDVDVQIVENLDDGATVSLHPRGLLPFDATVDVTQSRLLASLLGTHDVNTADAPVHQLGRRIVHRVNTSAALAVPSGVVHDVFLESFDDTSWQAESTSTLPQALWATPELDGTPSSALQTPTTEVAESLGDFRPLASPDFDGTTSPDANVTFVFLDTGAQSFPLPSGATPDLTAATTIEGGRFVFDDFIIPEGVCVKVAGPAPLDVLVTGDVRIDGVLDVSGADGLGDDTFDTGFYPVPGGAGGPAAGRGGNGHPTRSNPAQVPTLDQLVTPETGERGFGPRVLPGGELTMLPVGGHGGLSTLGYDPDANGYPRVPIFSTQQGAYNGNEHHRPPGGGGGSYAIRGRQAHEGTGVYLVQSESTWFPFTRCTVLDGRTDALYGNEANAFAGITPSTPLQCVYVDGTLADPVRTKPGGLPGDGVFVDDDPTNDYVGVDGELETLFGGQGGGGGGSRIDSMDHLLWSADKVGSPVTPGFPYPKLFAGVALSPTRYDAKGGGGGGGGGAVRIRAHGDLRIGRTGRIDASGGKGGGGEIVQASSWAGGGGGGSGGVVLLSAGGDLVLEADPGNRLPAMADADGDRGATIDVSGGLGKDARTSPRFHTSSVNESGHASRSDGGQGGFGLVQLAAADASPVIEQGAYVYARVRAMLKLGAWVDPTFAPFGSPFPQAGNNPSASDHPFDKEPHPRELWYYDLLHYRGFRYEDDGPVVRDLVVHGSDPAVIAPHPSVEAGPLQLDTPMTTYLGRRYVREPEPQFVLASWFGIEDDAEVLEDADGSGPLPPVPGTFFAPDADIPLNIDLDEPSGVPLYELVDGQQRLRADNLVDRLPLVHPDVAPFDLVLTSEGRSRWIDLSGASLGTRDALGRAPPFFDALNGVFANATPYGDAGEVITSSPVPGVPALYVANTPGAPFDPGLIVDGLVTDAPFNDVKVDAEEWGLQNAISSAATVRFTFQGAFGVRHGSSTPDPATITDWTADLSSLSGYPLVRFRIVFDIDGTSPLVASPSTLPRPAVDSLRMRMRY